MASQINIQGLITSTPIGTVKIGPIVITNTVNIAAESTVSMAAASATIPVPSAAGATPFAGCIIIPPTSSTIPVVFKMSTNSGDTGLPLGASTASLITYGSTTPTYLSFAFSPTANNTVQVKFF